jgi:SAM-dependent methyltransferase
VNGDTTDGKIKEAVRQTYGNVARQFVEEPEESKSDRLGWTPCCGPGQPTTCCAPIQPTSCCSPTEATTDVSDPAARFYSPEELTDLPGSVTGASAGCGNPIAIAELRPGEVVLDLGAGGGIDCFLAARLVGPNGRVIGLDMTPDMVRLARSNARKLGAKNVDFRFGEMEDIPLPDESVDVIVSNCVINLSPDKDAAFGEAYRVLRPGGRMNISDIVLAGELPQAIRGRLDAWAGCIAGALEESDYLGKIRAAGFERVEVISRDYASARQVLDAGGLQLLAVSPHCPVDRRDDESDPEESRLTLSDLTNTVASIKIRAHKPG